MILDNLAQDVYKRQLEDLEKDYLQSNDFSQYMYYI